MSHDITIFQCLPKIFESFKLIEYKTPRRIPCFSYIRTVNIICVKYTKCLYHKLSYLFSILPILIELSTPCNGRNIRWFLKVLNKQLNQKRFCYQIILIFIERIVYFDKKFAMSL